MCLGNKSHERNFILNTVPLFINSLEDGFNFYVFIKIDINGKRTMRTYGKTLLLFVWVRRL